MDPIWDWVAITSKLQPLWKKKTTTMKQKLIVCGKNNFDKISKNRFFII